MLFLFVFLILTLVLLFLVLGILFQGGRGFILWLRNKPCLNALKSIKRTLILGFIMLTLNVGVIVVSGFLTHTPQIKDENGNFVEGAIAELKALRLNGRKQWVSIRGGIQTIRCSCFWQEVRAVHKWLRSVMNWRSWKSILW